MPEGQSFALRRLLRVSLLAETLRSRWLAGAAPLLLIIETVLLPLARLPGWRCPVLALTGYPCAGCGLSRSLRCLVHGQLHRSLAYHAFGIVGFAVAALCLVSVLLPEPARQRLIARVHAFETRSGAGILLLVAFLAYWLARLCLVYGYVTLMRGA